jgi:hypothetical protein
MGDCLSSGNYCLCFLQYYKSRSSIEHFTLHYLEYNNVISFAIMFSVPDSHQKIPHEILCLIIALFLHKRFQSPLPTALSWRGIATHLITSDSLDNVCLPRNVTWDFAFI